MNYLENLFGLSGKCAVVIGATGELCGAMAEGLAGAGAYVYVIGRNPEKGEERLRRIREIGGEGEFLACDVSSKDELEGLRDAILADRPGVDVLVNGAGINSPTPFLDITEEEFDQILSVNLKAILLSCQVFGQAMLDRNEGGSIINLGSISGLNHTAMKRFGDKEELIGATLLLASQNAGSFITGTEMVVDGGYDCMTI